MKKILLIALTVMMAAVTNAQTLKSNKNSKVLPGKPMPTLMQAKIKGDIKAAPQVHARISKGKLDLGKKLTLSQKAQQTLKVTSTAAKAAPRKASALKESYKASGTNYSTRATDLWTLSTGTMEETGEPCFIDMLPYLSIFGDQGSVAVPYTVDGDNIVVQPTCVGEGEDEQGKYYILLFSAVDEAGCIRLTLGEDGKLATTSGDYIVYGAWEQPEYKYEEDDSGDGELVGYQGYFSMYTGVQYLTEDEIPVPTVRYEPVSTYYHIGTSSSGYGYIANYAQVLVVKRIKRKNLLL